LLCDKIGDFGFFRELSAASGGRAVADTSSLNSALNPPALSGAFRTMTKIGTVSRSGYISCICLPDELDIRSP